METQMSAGVHRLGALRRLMCRMRTVRSGIERFVPVCARLAAACSLPIWIKANAGLPEMRKAR